MENNVVVFSGNPGERAVSRFISRSKRRKAIKYITITAVLFLVGLFFLFIGDAAISCNHTSKEKTNYSLAFFLASAVFLVLSVKGLIARPRGKEKAAFRPLDVRFDGDNKIISFSTNSSDGKKYTVPFSAISGFVKADGYCSVALNFKRVDKELYKNADSTVPVKLGAIYCDPSLITYGSNEDFERIINDQLSERKERENSRRQKIKALAIVSIILSVAGAVLSPFMIIFGKYLMSGHISAVWAWFSSGFGVDELAVRIVIGFFLLIILIAYTGVAIFLGVICLISPVAFFVPALVLWIVQICMNRKPVSFVAIGVWVVSLVALMVTLSVTGMI